MTDDSVSLPYSAEELSQIRLFWEAAQPLKRVVSELPETTSFPIRMRPKVRTADLSANPTILEIASKAVETELEGVFPNLPEPVFERLVLRFRPFYIDGEDVSFHKVLNILARRNARLRDWSADWRKKWERAAFWGAMSMSGHSPQVDAEKVIHTGLYSEYFHLNAEHRATAKAYVDVIGADMFRAALVSSVWQRSKLVVSVANDLQHLLQEAGVLSEEDISAAASPPYKERLTLKLLGEAGAVKITVLHPNPVDITSAEQGRFVDGLGQQPGVLRRASSRRGGARHSTVGPKHVGTFSNQGCWAAAATSVSALDTVVQALSPSDTFISNVRNYDQTREEDARAAVAGPDVV